MGKHYNNLKQQAYNLVKELGIFFSGRVGKGRNSVYSLDEVADEKLPLVINNLESLKTRLFYKGSR